MSGTQILTKIFPDTAASTAGASLYDLDFEGPVDLTDGSWTLEDPDSLIQSISFSGGFHTVVWNALGAGSSDYNWASGTNHRAPRWYKNYEIDGTRITSDDVTQFVVYIETDNTNRGDFNNAIAFGCCQTPTSTTATTLAGMGLYANAASAGTNTALGVWAVNAAASTAVGTSDRCMTTVQYGGGHVGSGCFTVLDSSGNRIQNGSRNGTTALTAATDLSLICGLGVRGNTDTIALNDESQRFKVYFKAVKLNLGGVL